MVELFSGKFASEFVVGDCFFRIWNFFCLCVGGSAYCLFLGGFGCPHPLQLLLEKKFNKKDFLPKTKYGTLKSRTTTSQASPPPNEKKQVSKHMHHVNLLVMCHWAYCHAVCSKIFILFNFSSTVSEYSSILWGSNLLSMAFMTIC